MKNNFKNRARKTFWEITLELAESISTQFPSCADTKDLILYANNVIIGDESEEEKGIISWFNSMLEPLKKTKYSKAVERINGTPACVYHAIQYKDHEALLASSSSVTLKRLNLSGKLTDSSFSEENKALFWKYLNEMNKNACEFIGKEFPYVPSREEIAENIKKQKTSDSGSSSQSTMLKGFLTSLSTFCEMRGSKNCYDLSGESECSKQFTRWVTVSKMNVDETNVPLLCKQRNPKSITVLSKEFPEISWEHDVNEKEWGVLDKLFSYCQVGNAIPGQMMGKIENMANKLAGEIMSGKQDLASMDLQKIGEEVLSQCNPNDMNHFANNIDKILPAINNLK